MNNFKLNPDTQLLLSAEIAAAFRAQDKKMTELSRAIGCSGGNMFDTLPYYR